MDETVTHSNTRTEKPLVFCLLPHPTQLFSVSDEGEGQCPRGSVKRGECPRFADDRCKWRRRTRMMTKSMLLNTNNLYIERDGDRVFPLIIQESWLSQGTVRRRSVFCRHRMTLRSLSTVYLRRWKRWVLSLETDNKTVGAVDRQTVTDRRNAHTNAQTVSRTWRHNTGFVDDQLTGFYWQIYYVDKDRRSDDV